jgi:hypothetical protein
MLPRRPFWVTILDIALIVSASAALVIALGGRTRLSIGNLQISLRSPVNALAIAAACGLLRLFVGGRVRLLPALPIPAIAPLIAERDRFAAWTGASRSVLVLGAVAVAGSLVWIAPHLLHIRDVPDAGDPLFSAWRIARFAHQLTHDPRHLFDGNTFYPLPLTLTYSDATVLESLLGTPFIVAGVDPLVVANALTLLAFPANGLAFFYAAWRLTGDPRAALVAGLVGAWYPFHAEHYSHIELQWSMFVPLAIVTMMRMLAAPGWRTGLLFGASVAAQCLASMYIGVMLVSFLVPFAAVIALAWQVRPSRTLLRAGAGAAAVLLPAAMALGVPFLASRAARGDRATFEVSEGSALPSDYGKAHIRLVTYQGQGGRGHHPERELFPGTTPLALAAIGLVPPLSGGAIATIVAGAITFDWSLGLKGLTYDDLYKRSAIYRGMRVPARFSVVVGAALALLAGYGARRVLQVVRTDGLRTTLCVAMAAIVLVDLHLDPRLVRYPHRIPEIYQQVTPSMVLAELPRLHDVDYMYFSTSHWAHLLSGYTGFVPFQEQVERGLNRFPAPDGIAALREQGATHLTYNCAFEGDRDRCAEVFRQLDANPSLELVATETWESAPIALYRFKQPGPEDARSR